MVVAIFLIPVFLIGCNQEQTIEVKDSNEEQSETVKEVIRNSDEIYTGNAIFIEDQLLVAVQAKPWLDYKKRKIEKKLQKEVEEQFPDLEVLVSADYKLYWETQKLLDEGDEQKVSEEVEKLKKLAKEET
ncbi:MULTISPECIES: YhcN/YlaJ family sporulation lipoprotein [Lysinibacillus]|nr:MULTISPECIES: YhcN/YlaJ family sporulation lipoprotein [Lysinibacillus]